jgi:hypothetical protein
MRDQNVTMYVTIEVYAIREKVLFSCLFKSSRQMLSSDFSCLTRFACFANCFDLIDHNGSVVLIFPTEFVMESRSINMQHGFMFMLFGN